MSSLEHDISNPKHVRTVLKNGKFIVNVLTEDGITIEYGIPLAKQSKSQIDLDVDALRNLLDPI
jgi:hypothetical protein